MVKGIIAFCLQNKLVVALLTLAIVFWGLAVAPFDWDLWGMPRNPVPVDAIPDIGENQQIVFTDWPGRSPQDVEDQISYPLTTALLGIPGVKTIRTYSMFGFSSVYIVFEEEVDFYWSRSRVLEKLNSLPAGTLPSDVQPMLGPDATALGQIYWYTLEGHDPDGRPVGGWGLHELRSIQDWYVRYSLTAAGGVAEVASIGGFVQEYQIDVDPDAMRAFDVTLNDVFQAVRESNIDVGARTIEINRIEYVVRGLGFVADLSDIENTVVAVRDNVPVLIRHIAHVTTGPALRRGLLDKEGAEAVGGVVVARYGANPLQVIKNVKARIAELAPGLPSRVLIDWDQTDRETVAAFAEARGFDAFVDGQVNQEGWLGWLRTHERPEWPPWATTSTIAIVPFYDRTGLIHETLGTLQEALTLQILITVIVVLIMVWHLRSSLLISALLPLAVLMTFIAMRLFGVDANIVALSGIAIAIGTMVDMGIVMTESILRRKQDHGDSESPFQTVLAASADVGSAVITAVATTVVGFLPVFTMIEAEGKLFRPLAFTKTFALIASLIVAIVIVPPMAHLLFGARTRRERHRFSMPWPFLGGLAGLPLFFTAYWWVGLLVLGIALYGLVRHRLPQRVRRWAPFAANALVVAVVAVFLARAWMPLGLGRSLAVNLIFVVGLIAVTLGGIHVIRYFYVPMLRWCLAHKLAYLTASAAVIVLGGVIWLGFGRVFAFVPAAAEATGAGRSVVTGNRIWSAAYHAFPGLGKEFMPPLDEGSFLYMPTTMPHASIGEVAEVLQYQDRAIASIPEVDMVVGKLGRVESPLDPAPVSMIETVISYRSEYLSDEAGHPIPFRYDRAAGEFVRDANGELIPDPKGRPFRQWRDHISSPDDIWQEIIAAAEVPGTTSAPKLQPIAARIVMLQSGMRAPMGVKVKGPDLQTIEAVGLEIERLLKEVPGVRPESVFADRIVGMPYLEIDIDREAIARFGISVQQVQDVIEVAIGGRPITTTVEGRERYPVRVRYLRELRDDLEALYRILVPAADGAQIPLGQLATVEYVRGPQMIKSEDTFLVGYVLFDKMTEYAEVDVVEAAQRHLAEQRERGELVMPPGVSYAFAGSYENQVRSQKTLSVILPLALFVIFLILYLQFRSVTTSLLVFSGIVLAWSGGFILIWFYGQPWFLDTSVFGVNLRELFQIHPINLSVAIWVGFLALFGIASDDGVLIATYLEKAFKSTSPATKAEVRAATVEGASRRVRPCLMTTATTILALFPILTSSGRGADIMIPMAIPSFGGMVLEIFTMFQIPVLYCLVKETSLRFTRAKQDAGGEA